MNAAEVSILSESLFSIIPLLHDQLIKPFESLFRGGLSPMQFYTMVFLQKHGPMAMTELASYFGIPKQQMTKIVNRLVEFQVVQRQQDIRDKRLIRVGLTAHGMERLEYYRSTLITYFNEALSELDGIDQQELLDAFRGISRILPKLSASARQNVSSRNIPNRTEIQ